MGKDVGENKTLHVWSQQKIINNKEVLILWITIARKFTCSKSTIERIENGVKYVLS